MDLIFATHNNNKLQEVQLLMPKNIKLLSLNDVGVHEEIPELEMTIEGNAISKTSYIKERFDIPVFSDDTGLIVPSLNGAPGVLSARYAGNQKNSDDNMNLLLDNLKKVGDRSAYFQTVISLYIDGSFHKFEGKCHGTILEHRQGRHGFGYDPIFKPSNYEHSFAEMSMEEKSRISHRGIALNKLIAYLNGINIE